MSSVTDQKYFTIFNEASDAIVTMDDRGMLTDVNRTICVMLGYTREEMLGMNIGDIIDPEQLAQEPIASEPVLTGKHILRERRLRKKDGTILEVEVNVKRVAENLIVAIGRDVTRLRQTEAALKKMNHEVGERVKELNYLYRASKLANTPGRSIENILQELTNIIPSSYQYPEITCARVTYRGASFLSHGFAESPWRQSALIHVDGQTEGSVEVFYLREMPAQEEGPFLREERLLIDSIAEIVGTAAERNSAEALVKEQAELFGAIIENTKESIYLISPDYKLLRYNNIAAEKMFATQQLTLRPGADFRDYLFPEHVAIFHAMFQNALNGIFREEELCATVAGGAEYWFLSRTSPVFDSRHQLIGVRLLTEDINDRKRAEASLKESEEKFRSIVEQSLVGIYIIQNGKLVYVNPGFEKIFGYSKSQLLQKMSLEGMVHPDDISSVQEIYEARLQKSNVKQQYVFRALRSDAAVLVVEVIAALIMINGAPAIIGTLIDITDRTEEEHRMNEAVLEAQERERLQIGMELHDNVQQILTASGLYIDMAKASLNDGTLLAEILDNLGRQNSQAVDELRRLSHQLAPLIESETVLDEKIAWLVSSLKLEEQMTVSVDVDPFDPPLHNATQLQFYRILQEQLSNTLKYSGASAVAISVHQTGQGVLLQVRDNGRGFEVAGTKGGIGLENIRRRAQMLNGKAEIISSPGNGCVLKVWLPQRAV